MANANANANDEIYKHEKTITLNKLDPSEYRTWFIQAEATLGVYECLEIVRGTEQNPTPPLNANGNLPAINAALRVRIKEWNRRHERAREALLKCLNSADFMKVYSVRESASAIWIRLHEEYGQILNLEYIRAILAIAAANDLFILHVDCTSAFLNGWSDLELYVLQPEG